jgi:hypothetical protein
MVGKYLWSILVILILVSTANAFTITEFPSEITISETPKRFSFLIENNSGFEKEVTIQYFVPAQVEQTYIPEKISGGKTDRITITIYPNEELTGSSYNASMNIKLGSKTEKRNFTVLFTPLTACPATIFATSNKTNLHTPEKSFVEIFAQNNGTKNITIKIKEIKGAPADWKFGYPEEFTLNAFETKNLQINITPKTGFEGEIELIFECREEEIKEKIYLKYEGKKKETADVITGFFTLMNNTANENTIINAVLFLLVAVLLVSFVSRFVKVLHAKENNIPEETEEELTPRMKQIKENVEGKK